MLGSIKLSSEPEYAFFSHLLANRSLELFERTTDVQYLNQTIDLLEQTLVVHDVGSHQHILTSVELACARLQCYLAENHLPALEIALEILDRARESASASDWTSRFGDIRTMLVLTDVLRIRYEDLGYNAEDLPRTMHVVKSLLGSIQPANFQYTTFQVLVITIVLILAQTVESDKWFEALSVLHGALQEDSSSSSSTDALDVLSVSLDHCIPSSSAKAMCLIHLADTFDRRGASPERRRETGINPQVLWDEEWKHAVSFLGNKINLSAASPTVDGYSFQLFRFQGEVVYRPSLRPPRWLNVTEPVGTHICAFNITPTRVDALNSDGAADNNTNDLQGHHLFYHHLQNLIEPLSNDELDYLIDNPDTFEDLLAQSDFFQASDEEMMSWKQSPAIQAYIITKRYAGQFRQLKQAGRAMVRVKLSREPAYAHLLVSIAADLRRYEEDQEFVGNASRLFKEFLRSQERGTPRHLFAIIELASSYIAEYVIEPRTTLFTLALELFREAISLTGFEPWVVETRKIMVLGRILRIRYTSFEDSDESMETTTALFGELWDLVPSGLPFCTSALETFVISALIYLSRTLPPNRWHAALQLFTLTLDLQIFGTIPDDENFKDIKDVQATCQDLLDNGLYPASFSLASEAMCIIHTSDLIRATALDCSRNPGLLHLSLHLYRQSLRIVPPAMGSGPTAEELQLRLFASEEYTSLQSAALACAGQASFDVEISQEETATTIFHYCVARITRRIAPSSSKHSCLLRYYPTRLSHIRTNDTSDDRSSDSPPLRVEGAFEFDPLSPWPDDLLSRSPNAFLADILQNLPSTLVPGIHDMTLEETQQLFAMPLEARTIKAFMDDTEFEIRTTEAQVSHVSEGIVHQLSKRVYWDYREVQLERRVEHLKAQTPYISRLAPLQTLLSRGPERCLELIEASRSLFWARLLRLRSSFDGLPDVLAMELKQVAQALEECSSQTVASVEKKEAQKQFELEGIFEALLAQARDVPGFEGLLKPKTSEMLFRAAAEGPVVVLMGMDSMYAALVVRQKGVEAVFLKGLVDASLEKMIVGLNGATRAARGEARDVDTERYGRRIMAAAQPYEALLASLWQLIVKPIFDFMGLTTNSDSTVDRQRLWWCPTGRFAFLPIHAAGINFGRVDAESTSKYVVSSYTPTLSALISARLQNASSNPVIKDLKTLILAQPTTKGHMDLPMTLQELELVEKAIPAASLLRVGDGRLSEANTNRTVGEALEHLAQTSVLHLACHGHQDRGDPLSSGFELRDGRLTISKLMSRPTPHAVLAFLSACESASNDLDIPDEALNLAAAMLYAGFRSVIGTMWTMNDSDGPQVAYMIYEELFRYPEQDLEPKIIPYALDSAVKNLQAKGIQPSRWATYIHVGI